MSSVKRVLLVEDDAMLRASLAEQLSQESAYSVVETGDCAAARQAAGDCLYEFMVLDVGLPDGDGRELCREFRAQGITCPILLLTAADTDADTIAGLKSGANDYVTKPFRFAVLMARVHAQLVELADHGVDLGDLAPMPVELGAELGVFLEPPS